VTVAANGTQAVSASLDGTTLVWRLASGRLTKTLSTPAPVAAVQSAPDAERVRAAFPDGTAYEWDLASGSDRRYTSGQGMRVTAFAVAADGSRAVTGDLDQAVTVWDLTAPAPREPILRLPQQAGRVIAVAVSADGARVAAACGTGDVTVWDVKTARVRLRLHHERGVTALCLTPTGHRIVLGDAESATVHAITRGRAGNGATSRGRDTVVGHLATRARVTALAANPALPSDVILGTASGQVAYIRVP
jgi:WD40 repeat protein